MKTLEWKTVDKSAWGEGPWQDEPDKRQWVDEATGLPCLIVRGGGGALCGYVGISQGHPLFEKDWSDVDVDLDCHGGLTFANHCCPHPDNEGRGVCHVVEAGDDDNVWWLGFDCAHSGDISPKYDKDYHGEWFASYKQIGYVTNEVRSLAGQLAAAAPVSVTLEPEGGA